MFHRIGSAARWLQVTAALVSVFVALLIVACTGNPHNLKITDANKDSFMEQLKDSKGLTVEEMGLLMSSQMRRAATKTLGGTDVSVVGKTVGELIDDERKVRADAKIREEEEKRLAAEAKAKADVLTAQLRNAISLTVFDKGFRPSSPMDGQFDAFITLKCVYENKSDKDIRAFRGHVQFTDLFGKEIFTTNLTISNPIAAGQKANWTGVINYNQFNAEQQSLRNAGLADMKIIWLPDSVLFADGSSLGSSDAAK
jgi:hypothetical protein